MKKNFLFTILVFCVLGFSFALEAKVVSVSGKAEMQEDSFWVPLSVGDTVEKGAVISTGFNSSVVFEVSGSKFSLGPLTRMVIEDLVSADDKDSTRIFIDSGSVAASVNSKDNKRAGFKVRSPIATASVRGTEFEMTAGGKLSVGEGLVSFTPTSDPKNDSSATASKNEAAEISDEHAGIFDSTLDVAGDFGVPVAKGQSSSLDSSTGFFSKPNIEMAKNASASSSMTESLSSKETVVTASINTSVSASKETARISSVKTGLAGIDITFEFE